jgi:hypothetical protein
MRRPNSYSGAEWSGACGDLGTLIPFVVGYITIVGIDPQAVLLSFGGAAIATGLYFRTPMPVQPMKAIATAVIAQAGVVTLGMVWISTMLTAQHRSARDLRIPQRCRVAAHASPSCRPH